MSDHEYDAALVKERERLDTDVRKASAAHDHVINQQQAFGREARENAFETGKRDAARQAVLDAAAQVVEASKDSVR